MAASRRTILILFSVLSAFVASSNGATTSSANTVAASTSSTTPQPVDSTEQPATTVPTTLPTAPPTAAAGDTEGFDDLGTVDYIIIGVTCATFAGIIIGAIIVFAKNHMRKKKDDSSSLVSHGHHPEYITELGEGISKDKMEL